MWLQMFGDTNQELDTRLEMIFGLVQSMAANVFDPIAASETNPQLRTQPPFFFRTANYQTVSPFSPPTS